jgi:hypothetical protein
MSGALVLMGLAAGGVFVTPLVVANNQADAVDPADATATITFSPDGTISNGGRWYSNANGGGKAWIRATLTAGTNPTSGAMGSWQSLATARSWTNTRTSIGGASSTITFEIARDAAGASIVSSDTGVVISATVTS